MSDTRTVTFKVVREETWYPEYEVPSNLDDDEVLDYIHSYCPDEVFDDMLNKYTYDFDMSVEITNKEKTNV